MDKPSSLDKPTATRSINIGIYKPKGISSFWSWFTNKNKKVSLQNMMCDKRFGLKLNAEELKALKVNGIDLQKLQNFAAIDPKMRRNMITLSKDQSQLNDIQFLNNSVFYDLLKNKDGLNRIRKYKKSLVTSSTVSVKSKRKILNCNNVTYIHRIKSKNSDMNSGNSKVSLKVGLKSSTNVDISVKNLTRNLLMKGIPEELLNNNVQKKMFVPLYLGKKKSSKTNKGEKNTNIENKSKYRTKYESNIIPLLLTKVRTMEGQISEENITAKINKTGRLPLKKKIKTICSSNSSKDSPFQLTYKGMTTHKILSKISSKRVRQNKTNEKNKNNRPIPNSKNSSNNEKISYNNVSDVKVLTPLNSNQDEMKNIKNILDNPKNLLKYHSFVIPSNFSEKALFKANPDAGCDMILKLFESLTVKTDLHKVTDTSDAQNKKIVYGITTQEQLKSSDYSKVITSNQNFPRQFVHAIKSELGCNEKVKHKSVSSVSESQVDLIKNCSDRQKTSLTPQKQSFSCSPSSIALRYISTTGTLNQMHEMSHNTIEDKLLQVKNRHDNPMKKTVYENKSCLLVSEKELNVNSADPKTIAKEDRRKVKKEKTSNISDLPLLLVNESITISNHLMKNAKIQTAETNSDSKMFPTNSERNTGKDELNIKLEENINLKFQTGESKTENQGIKIPIGTDSRNVCRISIEQTQVSNTTKQSERNSEGTTASTSESKNEPKFSITILVNNNLNDRLLLEGDIPTNNENISSPTSFEVMDEQPNSAVRKDILPVNQQNSPIEVKDKHPNLTVRKDILPVNQQESRTRCQSIERSFSLNSKKHLPLKFETSDSTSTLTSFPPLSSLVDEDNIKDEKCSNPNADSFGIKGVSYLKQEERKIFDKQILNTVIKNPNKKITTGKIKPVAKSTIDLKYNVKPVRHLSESSLNPQKTLERNIYKQSIQPRGNTHKSVKSCRKTPYQKTDTDTDTNQPTSLLECPNFRTEFNVTNRLETMYTNKNQTSSQGDYVDKAILRDNKEFYVITDTTNCLKLTLNNSDYFDMINQQLTAENIKNKKGDQQGFFVINEEIPKNIETLCTSQFKKRSYRYHMTLNQEPISNSPGDCLFYDNMSIGDHQTRRHNETFSQVINDSMSVENIENRRVILKPVPEMSKWCSSVIDKVTVIKDSKQNIDLTEQPYIAINSLQEISTLPECAMISQTVPETPKCPQILDKVIVENDSKQNKSLSKNSNVTVASQLKKLDTSDCALVSSSVLEMPKCCSSYLTEQNIGIGQCQVEVMSEKTDSLPDDFFIICNSCFKKLQNINNNLCEKKSYTSHETSERNYLPLIQGTDQNIKENNGSGALFVICDRIPEGSGILSQSVNINENGISSSNKLAKKEPQVTNTENKPMLFSRDVLEEVLDTNPQNVIRYSNDKQMCCYHPCLASCTSSEDSLSSVSSDNQAQSTHYMDVSSTSELSNKCDIGNEILNYYSKRNERYSLEHLIKSTTVFHFKGDKKYPFRKTIPDSISEKKEEIEEGNYIPNHTKYKDEGYISSSLDMNYEQEDCCEMDGYPNRRVVNNGNQFKNTQQNLEIETNTFNNIQPMKTSKTDCTDLANCQCSHLSGKSNNSGFKNESYKNFKRDSLKTIKEDDLERISHDSLLNNYSPQIPSQEISFSTNYAVNYVHNVEYDFMRKNGNSMFACSLNSYSSTNTKILRD